MNNFFQIYSYNIDGKIANKKLQIRTLGTFFHFKFSVVLHKENEFLFSRNKNTNFSLKTLKRVKENSKTANKNEQVAICT